MFLFLPTEPFRRWLAGQAFEDAAALTAAGIALGAWLLL